MFRITIFPVSFKNLFVALEDYRTEIAFSKKKASAKV